MGEQEPICFQSEEVPLLQPPQGSSLRGSPTDGRKDGQQHDLRDGSGPPEEVAEKGRCEL